MENKPAGKINTAECANGETKKKRMTPLLASAGVIIVLGFAWYWYANLRGFVATDNAYIDANYVSSKNYGNEILENCLFGVDLNPEAVEIAKLSL